MIWFKRDPLLAGLILTAAISVIGEGYGCWQARREAIRALAILQQRSVEREKLAGQSPAVTEENERATDHDLSVARAKLAEVEQTFGGVARAVADIPAVRPTDAYFEIAGFIEKTRALAVRSRVSFGMDEHFGFASYASEGPAVEIAPAVLRRRAAAETLIEILFAAQPAALLSLQREHPTSLVAQAGKETPADFFEFPPGLSLRRPGVLESDAFKLEFSGSTRSLRDFVNGVAAQGIRFAVRNVESEPAEGANQDRSSAKVAMGVPVIVEKISRFRVVVERLRPVTEMKETAP